MSQSDECFPVLSLEGRKVELTWSTGYRIQLVTASIGQPCHGGNVMTGQGGHQADVWLLSA